MFLQGVRRSRIKSDEIRRADVRHNPMDTRSSTPCIPQEANRDQTCTQTQHRETELGTGLAVIFSPQSLVDAVGETDTELRRNAHAHREREVIQGTYGLRLAVDGCPHVREGRNHQIQDAVKVGQVETQL
jgi:hypothetical protein